MCFFLPRVALVLVVGQSVSEQSRVHVCVLLCLGVSLPVVLRTIRGALFEWQCFARMLRSHAARVLVVSAGLRVVLWLARKPVALSAGLLVALPRSLLEVVVMWLLLALALCCIVE